MRTLRLITSCSQRQLLEVFSDNISNSPLSPLEKESIVVLSNGMARWISMELAGHLGISAGLEFSFPNDLLDRCFKAILPEAHSSLPFTRTSLTWRIASQLPQLSPRNGFEQIAAYLGDGRDDRRLLQISGSLADCFDQYTIFRPEMVCAWDEGECNDWQAQLWRAVSDGCRESHRAALLKTLQRHVSCGAPPNGLLPRRVSLFGISYLPPFHLEALRLLSTYCDVSCYLLNPCGQYWGTILPEKRKSQLALQSPLFIEAEEYYETGNSLLSSLGTLGQEFFETLLEYGFEAEELNRDSAITLPDGDTARLSILATIQGDIINLFDRPGAETKPVVHAYDRSLQIHSCHGPLREMEILHDNLLGLFDELADLEPRQIVVMVPDIESYAPYIASVFGHHSSGRPALPYTIADQSARKENQYVNSFLRILDIASGRFALQETLDLLELPAVMNRYAIDEDDLSAIRIWLNNCNVRWGLDADHRSALGFPHYDDFSWQAGLDRLFLGYAMQPEEYSTFNGILPYPDCSGQTAAALGKLTDFITAIRDNNVNLSKPHTLSEWADIFSSIIAQMMLPDENDSTGPLFVAKALHSIREAGILHGFSQTLTLDAMRDHLAETMTTNIGGYGFMGGAITFCAMLPMRSIPMRVIWLAGMNDGQFPRSEKPPGFSLMGGARRRGDRSLRNEDRYLFLEALMAAEERFCISYNGQNNRDNSTMPPSVLVAELIDYVAKGFVMPDNVTPASILTKHRLQGFSPRYFDNTAPTQLFSYDRETCQAVETRRVAGRNHHRFILEPLPIDTASVLQIDLQQLGRFFTNPAASFLEQRLLIKPFNPAEEPEDSEPFSLDTLTRYNLSQELVEQLLKGEEYHDCLAAARSRGTLPPMSAGKAAFDAVWEKSRQFAANLAPQLGTPLEALTVTFTHKNIRLNAVLENCRCGKHVRWRSSGMKGKDRLTIWLDHLLLNLAKADGYPLRSVMMSTDMAMELPPLDHAAEILSDLLDLYGSGMTQPLPFFPETSWAVLKDGQRKAEAVWRGDQARGFPGECDNQAVAFCFRDFEPWGEDLRALAERVYGPLLAAIG